MSKTFAVMWDCYGLEAIECVSDIQQQITLETLKTGRVPKSIPFNVGHWLLRAQANPQRNYEIYVISAESGIDQDDIVAMFKSSPQQSADLCRKIGHQYYSNRANRSRVKIV